MKTVSVMSDKQSARRAQIEAAAFEVLEKVGYKKASMLQIAKQAKASNETLYAWYGNKQALFSSLIATNAQVVEDTLQDAISGTREPDTVLFEIGKLLLTFSATQQAIIINRAAVSDVQETGILAHAIEENARQVILRSIRKLMENLAVSGGYMFDEGTDAATEIYVGLLIGELQMQQSLGAVPALQISEIEQRSRRAAALFDRLYRNG